MKHVETNFLIHDLAKNTLNKKHISAFKFYFAIVSLSILSIFIQLLVLELRPNLTQLLSFEVATFFNSQLLVFVVAALLGVYLLYKQSTPGQELSNWFKLWHSLFYLIWLALFFNQALMAVKEFSEGTAIHLDMNCIERSLIAFIVPFTAIMFFLRKGFILQKNKATITAAFTAFAFASFINLFVCPSTSYLHMVISHHLIILPIIIILLGTLKLSLRFKK